MKKVLAPASSIFYVILFLSVGCFLLWIHQFALIGLRGFVQGDLGLLLNVPARIVSGQVPYRDFYAGNYTPGSYYFHAALFYLFGEKASLLQGAQALSQMMTLFFFFLLARAAWDNKTAVALSVLALLLAIPTTPIPFPAIYCILFALAGLYGAQTFLEKKHISALVLCATSAALAIAWKLSTGVFVTAMLLLYFFYCFRWRKALQIFAGLLVLGGLFLIKERLYVSTALLFIMPLLFLWFFVLEDKRFDSPLPSNRGLAILFKFGSLVVLFNLLWILPFLKILGVEKFLHHFIFFPALQPKILFYPAPLPISLDADERWAWLGFSGVRDFKSLWKLWFYFPALMSIVTFMRLRKKDTPPNYFAFFAYNALLPLQIFPTIDYLHFAWSAHGALLLAPLLYGKENLIKKPNGRMIKAVLAGLLCLQLLYYVDYVRRKKLWRGFDMVQESRLQLYLPSADVEALNALASRIRERLSPKSWFWNPPGSLYNFVLDHPVPLSSDYWGPPYWTLEEQVAQLAEIKRQPPQIVIVSQVNEAYFGWSAMQHHYPLFTTYLEHHYVKSEAITGYLWFERNLVRE